MCGRLEVGRLDYGRLGQMCRLGQLGRLERWRGERRLIDVKLVANVEEEACRLARETAGGGKGEMGGDQEIGNVFGVDLADDCVVAAGRASVAENSALVGSGPHETEDGSVDRRVGGSQVVEGKMSLGVGEDFR